MCCGLFPPALCSRLALAHALGAAGLLRITLLPPVPARLLQIDFNEFAVMMFGDDAGLQRMGRGKGNVWSYQNSKEHTGVLRDASGALIKEPNLSNYRKVCAQSACLCTHKGAQPAAISATCARTARTPECCFCVHVSGVVHFA